jgi:hypothetical protein
MNTMRKSAAAALAAVAVALAALAGTPAAAAVSATTDAGKPVWVTTPAPASQATGMTTSPSHIHSLNVDPSNGAHTCAPYKNPGDTAHEGVFCADIIVTGTNTIVAQAEAVCQSQTSGGGTFQCSNIYLSFSLWQADASQALFNSGTYICGHADGSCPDGRWILQSTSSFTRTSGCVEVWTTVNLGSKVDLNGSGLPAGPSGNLGSGHVWIGPDCS